MDWAATRRLLGALAQGIRDMVQAEDPPAYREAIGDAAAYLDAARRDPGLGIMLMKPKQA